MTAAQLIAEARKRAGLTQAALAERAGTHQSVVARWEGGRNTPDLATVQRLIRAAGFELAVSIHPSDDHDLTLIRRQLRLLPHQRLADMVDAVTQLERMVAAGA